MTHSLRVGDLIWDPDTLELCTDDSRVTTLEPRVAKLFEYLLAHPGQLLSHDHLVEAVWDGRVVSDEAVRQAVFNLRQALTLCGAQSCIRTVHKKGYIATFPTQVVTDRTYPEPLTSMPAPQGAHNEPILAMPDAANDAAATAPIRRPRRQYLPSTVAVIALLALGGIMIAQFTDVRKTEPAKMLVLEGSESPTLLAVLPFTNLSRDSDSDVMTTGIAEDLLSTLTRNRQLRVTARGSAFQFEGQNRDLREIGQILGVNYVLEGSVLNNVAERVQVSVQLVDTASATQLWAEVYDRPIADWLVLQQDIAGGVERALKLAQQRGDKTVARTAGTTNVEAHLEVLRARKLLATRAVGDAEQAIEHLQSALGLDPNYALAYARLADAILIQAGSTTGIKPVRQVVAPLLDKALTLDPELGEAYALRAMLTDDPTVAERDLRRGLELNPSYARGYELLANLQSDSLKQFDQAADSIDRAIALDPLTPGNYHTKAELMMTQGYWPESAALERRALDLNPQFRAAMVQLGIILSVEGHFAEAIGYAERAVALDPRAAPLRDQLAMLYMLVGENDSARAASTSPSTVGRLLMLWAQADISHAADMIYGGKSGPLELLAPEAASQILLAQALADRDFARARERLTEALPVAESLPPQAYGWRLYAYANLAQLLALGGDTNAAEQLELQIRERMTAVETRFPRHALINHIVRATLLARAGHSDEACEALERSYYPAPRLFAKMVLGNPAFDNMRSTLCFEALVSRIEAYLARERASLETMRRRGEIPDRSNTEWETVNDVAS